MPELPEVETIKEILKTIFLHRKITNVDVFYSPIIKSPRDEFVPSLINKTIVDIKRIGKFLIFCLSDNKVLISHLRMEGKYILLRDDEMKTKHTCLIFHLDNGKRISYDDSRKFGIMQIADASTYQKNPPISNVGIEPIMIHQEEQYDQIYQRISRQRRAIKSVLLDQSILAGLGNIYVDETLFLTKIHPETPAHLLTYEEIVSLIKNAKIVLLKAIAAGGSTIKSYHPGRDMDGHFQEELLCYGHSGESCPDCRTIFKKIFVGGRGTTYCPHCQKNRALPYVLGVIGPIATGKSLACNYLKTLGVDIISSDEIVHRLYMMKEVIAHLEKICKSPLDENGTINREVLRQKMSDSRLKKRVERYIHPLVAQKLEEFIKSSPARIVAIEVPLLFEAHLDYLCDATIAMDITTDQQIANLKKRNIFEAEEYLLLNSSNQFAENKEKVTYLIKSDNEVKKLEASLQKIYSDIRKNILLIN